MRGGRKADGMENGVSRVATGGERTCVKFRKQVVFLDWLLFYSDSVVARTATLVKNVGCVVLIQYQENVGPGVGEEMWQFGDTGVVTMESTRLCCNGGCVMSTCRCLACVMHSSESMQICTFTRLISDIGAYIRHFVAPAEASAEQESTLIQTITIARYDFRTCMVASKLFNSAINCLGEQWVCEGTGKSCAFRVDG